jgi:hypothetical protein
LLAALALLVFCTSGCRIGSTPLAEPITIQVVATRDFGREIVFEREAVIDRRMSAQDVLAEVTDFETDGSYILEFEELRGNDRVYWMYYINGLLSKYFAGGYMVRPGDVMHWDFHPWAGAHHGSSAIIGSFPEPLRHGYEGQTFPTTVVYSDGLQQEAESIATGLRQVGVDEVSVTTEASLAEADKGAGNLVLIADSSSALVSDLNSHHEPLGMYAYFEDGGLSVTDYKFQDEQSYGAGTGVLQACQNLWSPMGTGSCQSAIFMISGVDTDGVLRAVRLVRDSIDDIESGKTTDIANAFGVIITDSGAITRAPL